MKKIEPIDVAKLAIAYKEKRNVRVNVVGNGVTYKFDLPRQVAASLISDMAKVLAVDVSDLSDK